MISLFFRDDLNLTLPKKGSSGKQGVVNLSFTYTYADRQRWQKQLSIQQEEEDSRQKETDISKIVRQLSNEDNLTRF